MKLGYCFPPLWDSCHENLHLDLTVLLWTNTYGMTLATSSSDSKPHQLAWGENEGWMWSQILLYLGHTAVWTTGPLLSHHPMWSGLDLDLEGKRQFRRSLPLLVFSSITSVNHMKPGNILSCHIFPFPLSNATLVRFRHRIMVPWDSISLTTGSWSSAKSAALPS